MKWVRHTLGIAASVGLVVLLVSSSFAQVSDGSYRIFRPDGSGPFPAVVFVSGCSGFAPSMAPKYYERVAGQLRNQGYIVVFVDYLGRRGLKSCADARVAPTDAARDLVAAAAWLKSQRSVDQARITAMGWSYGAGAVLLSLAEHAEQQLAFSRAVVFYPSCRAVRPWKVATPVLMLLAGQDDVAPGEQCQEAAKRSIAPDFIKIVVYPEAQHAFDVFELPAKMRYPFGTVGYDRQAAAAAWGEIQLFLGPARWPRGLPMDESVLRCNSARVRKLSKASSWQPPNAGAGG